MTLSDEERRALGIIGALLVLAAGARWLERPRPVLDDLPALDLAAFEQASRDARPGARPSSAGPIDPNTADAAELARLPGIGPAVAARIVEERARAPFASLEDLARVRGIGPALLGRIAGSVTLPAGAPRAGRVDEPATWPATWPAAAASAASTGPAAPLDLNTATAAELQQLKGVGPVLAARLVARRDSMGGFGDWADVDAVPGVGPAMLERLKAGAVVRRRP
jgi:competence ComEA-like helix-hairpin-helix protein